MALLELNLGDRKIVDKVTADPKTTRYLQNLSWRDWFCTISEVEAFRHEHASTRL